MKVCHDSGSKELDHMYCALFNKGNLRPSRNINHALKLFEGIDFPTLVIERRKNLWEIQTRKPPFALRGHSLPLMICMLRENIKPKKEMKMSLRAEFDALVADADKYAAIPLRNEAVAILNKVRTLGADLDEELKTLEKDILNYIEGKSSTSEIEDSNEHSSEESSTQDRGEIENSNEEHSSEEPSTQDRGEIENSNEEHSSEDSSTQDSGDIDSTKPGTE